MKWKKSDGILIGIILCVAAFAFFWHMQMDSEGDGTVTVKVDGKIEGSYSLLEDREVSIHGGSNVLEIKDGAADMVRADCPDKLCVHQKAISKNGESIICLPNKVVVTVESSDEREYDAVVQ